MDIGKITPFLALFMLSPFCSAIMSSPSIKRQATVTTGRVPPPAVGSLAQDLLPPPALSASFPTLRPRRPQSPPRQNQPLPVNNFVGIQQPHRGFSPPFRPSPPIPNSPSRHPPSQNSVNPTSSANKLPLLPPIEIPPERPLTDNEILATLVPKESSFIPTTGQGVPSPSIGIALPPGKSVIDALPFSSEQTANTLGGNSSSSSNSAVRFPVDSELTGAASPASLQGSTPPRNCPSCECTDEVDYICASNGVLYLNSCSFDCATFCDSGIRKVELNFCSSQNQKNGK